MPLVTAKVECPVHRSFRVAQVESMFGLEAATKTGHTFKVEIPGPEESWKIGAIVGPSGGGKSTVAREGLGDCLYDATDWPRDKAMIDGYPEKNAAGNDLPTKQIVETLVAVGFGTAKDWRKPYHVLSNGQKFRADLARAMLSGKNVIAIDEMTSLLDRETAFACCTAAAKAIRFGNLGDVRLVAISCHYDITAPLEADWVLDMASQTLVRGSLWRPKQHLEVVAVEGKKAWPLFEPHHYLDSTLHPAAQCFVATWDGKPVALVAALHALGFKNYMRISRVVTLPDYQGMGIGSSLMTWCASYYKGLGKRVSINAAHPAVIRHCERRPAVWRLESKKITGNKKMTGKLATHKRAPVVSQGRPIVSFVYVGP